MSIAKDFETPENVIFPPGDLESNEPPLETYLQFAANAAIDKMP